MSLNEKSKTELFKNNPDFLINTVNCVGVMGAGVALAFKSKFGHKYYSDYISKCKQGLYKPGVLDNNNFTSFSSLCQEDTHIWKQFPNLNCIIDFTTKKHYKDPSQLVWIDSILNTFFIEFLCFVECLQTVNNKPIVINMPLPGCGNGGLNPVVVLDLIKNYWDKIKVHEGIEKNVELNICYL